MRRENVGWALQTQAHNQCSGTISKMRWPAKPDFDWDAVLKGFNIKSMHSWGDGPTTFLAWWPKVNPPESICNPFVVAHACREKEREREEGRNEGRKEQHMRDTTQGCTLLSSTVTHTYLHLQACAHTMHTPDSICSVNLHSNKLNRMRKIHRNKRKAYAKIKLLFSGVIFFTAFFLERQVTNRIYV